MGTKTIKFKEDSFGVVFNYSSFHPSDYLNASLFKTENGLLAKITEYEAYSFLHHSERRFNSLDAWKEWKEYMLKKAAPPPQWEAGFHIHFMDKCSHFNQIYENCLGVFPTKQEAEKAISNHNPKEFGLGHGFFIVEVKEGETYDRSWDCTIFPDKKIKIKDITR
jgi:hypothetical protein